MKNERQLRGSIGPIGYGAMALAVILIGTGIWESNYHRDVYSIYFVTAGIVLFVLVMFSQKISAIGWGDKRIEMIASEVADKVSDELVSKVGPNFISIKENGTKWINNWKAFKDASHLISTMAEDRDGGSIELRMIAISMSTSFDFVTSSLSEIANNYNNVQFKLRIAVVRSTFLSKCNLDTAKVDFAALSKSLPDRLKAFEDSLEKKRITNLTIEMFFYEGIPQWHGLLVDGNKLFLGRTDWDLHAKSRLPRLRCGENDYRYFDESTPDGVRRISQFRHWFTFYSDFEDSK